MQQHSGTPPRQHNRHSANKKRAAGMHTGCRAGPGTSQGAGYADLYNTQQEQSQAGVWSPCGAGQSQAQGTQPTHAHTQMAAKGLPHRRPRVQACHTLALHQSTWQRAPFRPTKSLAQGTPHYTSTPGNLGEAACTAAGCHTAATKKGSSVSSAPCWASTPQT